jgi:outer membrane protein TolC
VIRSDRTARGRRPVLSALLALGVSLPALGTALAADPTADTELRTRTLTRVAETVKAQLAPEITANDRERLPLVQQQLKLRSISRKDLVGRAIAPIGRRDAVVKGLQTNLTYAIAKVNPERADALLREIGAVFDPIFDLSISYTRSDTQDRTKIGTVRPKTIVPVFSPSAGGEVIFDDPVTGLPSFRRINFCNLQEQACDPTNTTPLIRALEFYSNTSTAPVQDTITANPGRTQGHPTQKVAYTLGLTQELPWGGTLTLTDATVQQRIFYRGSHYWEDGEFTTNLSGALSMPVPFTKGSGKDNPNNSALRQAQISRARADHELKSVLNQVLRDIDIAYFEVVRQLEALNTAVEHQGLIGQLKERLERMLKADPGLVTRYQEAQIGAEYTRAGVRVERALQTYINASIQLANLIGDPDAQTGTAIFLPYGYAKELATPLPVNVEAAMATARQNRPDFAIAGLNRESADVSLRLAENQALPDLRVGATVNSAQNGSTYGYADPIQSQARVARPDNLTQNYSITYTRPWGNRAANAAVDRARIGVEDQVLASRGTDTQVKRELTDRMSALQTARARLRLSTDEAKTLRAAYESLERQLGAGLVGEDQVITAARKLLDAEMSRISAMVDGRQAETGLLAAEGTIANVLPGQTARTAFERHRLTTLADAGYLGYFGQSKPAADEKKK